MRARVAGLPKSLWAVALIATTIKLVLVWRGFPETSLVADDAYYYFTIARNMAEGLGPTFDGSAITNGFHPLWQLLLVPVFRLCGDDLWTPVRVALSLAALCDLVSGLLIYRLLASGRGHGGEGGENRGKDLEGRRLQSLAEIATRVWFLLPATFLLGLRGMESSLNTLLILVVVYFLRRCRFASADLRPRHAVVAGILVAICGYARTDNLPVVGLALAGAVWFLAGAATRTQRLRWLALCSATAALAMAPWFLWSYLNFGSLMQVSGQVKFVARDLFGALPWSWSSPSAALSTVAHVFFAPFYVTGSFLCGEEFTPGYWTESLLGCALAAVALLLVMGLRSARRRGELRRATILFPALFVFLHGLLYGCIWRAYASWYALPCYALLIVLLSGVLGPSRETTAKTRGWIGAALVVVMLSQFAHYPLVMARLEHGACGPETRFTPLLEQAMEYAPEGAVLGAFDAGALGYVAGKYPLLSVLNLDGLVNNEAFTAAGEGRYADYIMTHVTFLVQSIDRTRIYLEPDEIERLRAWFQE